MSTRSQPAASGTSYKRRFDGASKGGDYSYPRSVVFEDRLYVIVARQKEVIELFSVALGDLKP